MVLGVVLEIAIFPGFIVVFVMTAPFLGGVLVLPVALGFVEVRVGVLVKFLTVVWPLGPCCPPPAVTLTPLTVVF